MSDGESKYAGYTRTEYSDGVLVGQGTIVFETEAAVKVDLGGDKPLWVPKSALHVNSEIWETRDEGLLWVTEWFAKKEGLS